jgi:hypothetical protein
MKKITKGLGLYNLNGTFVDYRRKWTQHLLRMSETRIPKSVYEYIPAGSRNVGRPRKHEGTNIHEDWWTYTLWLMMAARNIYLKKRNIHIQ